MSSSVCNIVDIEQGSTEWHTWRKTGVTATCSPILLNANGAMKTPYELYLQYVDLLAPTDLSAIKQVDAGKKLEGLARAYCEKELGQIASPFCVSHKKYPFMIASLDGQLDDDSVLEIKNLSEKNHLIILKNGSNSSEFIYYYWQVQHQLFVTGAPRAFLVFWSAKDQPKIFIIMPSQKAFDMLFAACSKFWEQVRTKTAPAFDRQRDVLLISDENILIQTTEFSRPDDLVSRVADLRRQVEQLQKTEDEYKKILEQKVTYEETLKASIQGLGTALGFPSGSPIRIDGFGFRYLEKEVKGTTNWKMIAEKLGADPSQFPDCVNQSSTRTSLSLYEYSTTNQDSVYFPISDISLLVSEGERLETADESTMLIF